MNRVIISIFATMLMFSIDCIADTTPLLKFEWTISKGLDEPTGLVFNRETDSVFVTNTVRKENRKAGDGYVSVFEHAEFQTN